MQNSVINGTTIAIILYITAQFQTTFTSELSGDMGSGIYSTDDTNIYDYNSGILPSPNDTEQNATEIETCTCNIQYSNNESCTASLTGLNQRKICTSWRILIDIGSLDIGYNITEISGNEEANYDQYNCTIDSDSKFVTVNANTPISLFNNLTSSQDYDSSGSSIDDDLFRLPDLNQCKILSDGQSSKNSTFRLQSELLSTLQNAIDCAFNRSRRDLPLWTNRYKIKPTVRRLQPAHSKEYMLLFILNFGLVLVLMKAIICFRDLIERRMTRKTKPPSRSGSDNNMSSFV